jgi:hypothetical protein
MDKTWEVIQQKSKSTLLSNDVGVCVALAWYHLVFHYTLDNAN